MYVSGGGGGAGHQNSGSTQDKTKGQNGGGIVYDKITINKLFKFYQIIELNIKTKI